MIQSDCGLVLRPICLISSATSAGLLSEHTPPAAKAKINTHTCINKKKTGIAAKDFLLLRNKRRDNQQQSYCTRGNPTKKTKKTGSRFYVLTRLESHRSAVKYSAPISPPQLKD